MTKATQTVGILSLIFTLGSLGVLGGMYYFIMDAEKNLDEVVHARAERIAETRQTESLEILINETQREREEIATRILEKNNVVSIVSLIERLAREHGLEVVTKDITTGSAGEGSAFEIISLQVEGEGDFDSVVDTLSVYDTLPFQSVVSDVSLTRGGDAWTGLFTIRITVYSDV